jgi:hypothetical protein
MVAEGRLSPGDAVRQGKSGIWVPAASVKGLFGGSTESSGVAQPPPLPSEPSPVPRSRPLLRAVPMDDDLTEVVASLPRERFLARDDAGLDLTRPPPELAGDSAKRAKGWRSTGLDFLAEVSRISAKGRKAASVGPGRRGKDSAEPIRRWTLPVLVGVFVLLLVVLLVVNQLPHSGASPDDAAETVKEQSSGVAAAQKTGAGEDGALPAPGQTGPPSAREPSGVTWIDASREAWKSGDVTVKVRAAAIGRAKLIDATKRVSDTQEDYLLLLVEIANRSTTRKIQYSSWNLRGERPRLTDNLKNPYLLQVAPGGGIFEGQQRVKSIYPEKTTEDLLVFERPVDKARSLRIQLPAAAFEGTGTGYIEIPMSMVKSDLGPGFQRPPEPPTAKGKAGDAAGQEKQVKKGDDSKKPPAGKPSAAGKAGEAALPALTGKPESDFGIKSEDAPPRANGPRPMRGPPPPPVIKAH